MNFILKINPKQGFESYLNIDFINKSSLFLMNINKENQ
jgi:hypothetical protein